MFWQQFAPIAASDLYRRTRRQFEQKSYLLISFASPAAALLIHHMYSKQSQSVLADGWLGAQIVVAAVYFIFFLRQKNLANSVSVWGKYASWIPCSYSLLWGLGWLLFFDRDHLNLLIMINAMIVTVSFLGIISTIYDWRISSLCILFISIPIFLGGFIHAQHIIPFISLVVLIHIFICISLAHFGYYLLMHWLEQQQQNDQLIVSLQQQQQQMVQLRLNESHFLAAASHDLRQPTQALQLFNYVLAPLLKTDDQKHVLRQIQGATDNITSLLNSLLDISRLDASVVDIHKHAFALDAVLAKVYQQCLSLAAEYQIILRYQPTCLWVYSDPAQLERIVQNLLTNAIKHSQNTRGKVVLGVRRKAGMACVWVLDNGVGIPVKEQQAIFSEFYQLNGDERQRSKGLGLGLAIVKRLTMLLSHPLQLLSQPQRGTCFQLTLPQAQPVTSVPAPVSAPPLVLSGQVLITDDDADIAQTLALLVRQCGGEPVIARQFVEIKRLVNPDSLVFILADYQLQHDRDGIELVFEVRDWLACDIPALVLTGNTNPQVLKNLALYGLEVLTKPVDPQLLFAEIQKHILTQIS